MRRRYRMDLDLGSLPIESIPIPMKSRDELPPVLRALQFIYCTPELKEKVFAILESKITLTKMGTPGMSLWEILIMGTIRLTLQTNYDRLEHIVNYDELVRAMLGVQKFGAEKKEYSVQTLRDNVYLLDETMLEKINDLVVQYGHEVKKKEQKSSTEETGRAVKIDSFVVESNVHFPTDYNLLWDSVRKALTLTERFVRGRGVITGWRKTSYWIREVKRCYGRVRRSSHRGGKHRMTHLKTAVREYLRIANRISDKLHNLEGIVPRDLRESAAIEEIMRYVLMLDKHIGLLDRRILGGEEIPHEEKIFSIFETYTEWISKGKANRAVELGLKVSVVTDEYGFIVRHVVMEKQEDVSVMVPVMKDLLQKYAVKSISSDKGFWSAENYQALEGKVKIVVMPKKGKVTQREWDREHAGEFIALRKKHSAVESNINMLEHHGASRCPDRGITGFRRYVGLSVLAYNLHRLGNYLLERDRHALRKAA